MKRNLILVFCALLGLSWYAMIMDNVNNPKKTAEHLNRATELETKGIYVDAIAEYEGALEYEPDNAEISIKMAEDYLKIGNSQKFTDICKDTAEKNQKDSSALEHLMQYYVENNDETTAVRYLNTFLAAHPENENAQKWMLKLKGSYEELYCNYEELSEITGNSMVVGQDGLYGMTDGLGDEQIKVQYEELYPYSEDGFALVRTKDGFLYMDRDGFTRLVPDSSYENLGMLASKRTKASVNGKYGYLDEKLEPVTDFVWDDLTLISDKTGAARQNSKWALVDSSGKEKTEYIYEDVIKDRYGFCCRQNRIFVKIDGSYHMVDKKGTTVGELSFEDAECFSANGYAAVCVNGKWGFVNAKGEMAIAPEYEDAESFHNGYAAVCADGKWGYIDEDGNLVIAAQFQAATAVSEKGTAAVLDDKWKLIQLSVFL